MLVLILNLSELFRYDCLKFGLLFFFNVSFSNYFRAERVKITFEYLTREGRELKEQSEKVYLN